MCQSDGNEQGLTSLSVRWSQYNSATRLRARRQAVGLDSRVLVQARMLACERASSCVEVQPSAGRVRACNSQETGRVRAAAARMQAAGSRAGERMARRGGSRASGRQGTSARIRAGGEAQQLQVLMFACRRATTSGDSNR